MALEKKLWSSFWSDEDVGRLDAGGKLAVVWVLTNKDMTNIGYLKVQGRQFQFDTGLEARVLEGCLKGLGRSFVFEDRMGGLGVLSLNFVKYQFGEGVFLTNSRLVSNLVALARGLNEPMVTALCERYKGLGSLLGTGRGMEGACMGLGSPQNRTVPEQNRAELSTGGDRGGPGAEDRESKNDAKNAAAAAGTAKNGGKNLDGKSVCTNVPRGTPEPGGANRERGEGQTGQDEAEGWEGQVVRQGRVGHGQLDFVAAEGLLRFLNERTGGLYPATPAIVREIALRLAEVGGDVAGCRRMIEQRVMAWSGDGKMAQFLRPDTLFRAEKFPIYFGQREQTGFGLMGEERKREQRKELEGRIERSRANRQSAYHSSEATAEEREALKGWRRELAELEK